MKRDVKLFLDGQEVEFKTVPDILYNFSIDDVQNPTVVKNSYSKTITLPGTPKNNKIFKGFYDNDQAPDAGFDPRKRLPFTITINGETYETGYARLDNVTQDRNYYEWSLSLFGGLGDFFYNLEYGANGEKRKMSDLIYREGNDIHSPEINIGFTISAGTLYEAWHNSSYQTQWETVNFAPCYDGLPSDFSSDKVLINYNGITDTVSKLGYSAITSGGTTYVTYNGYALATLPKDFTQAEMREFRSWQQRPVLSVRKAIEAMQFADNNGGYYLALDPDFFNSVNPYYNKLWVTLPLLSEISLADFSSTDVYTNHTISRRLNGNVNYNDYQLVINFLNITPALAANAAKAEFSLSFLTSAFTGSNGATAQTMYSSAYVENYTGTTSLFETRRNFSAYAIQIVAYAGTEYTSSVIGASEVAWLTSDIDGDFLKYTEIPSGTYSPQNGANIKYVMGVFNKQSNGHYKWSQDFTLTLEIPAGAKSIAVWLTPLANIVEGTDYAGRPAWGYGSRRRMAYTQKYCPTFDGYRCSMRPYSSLTEAFVVGTAKSYVSEGSTMGYSGAQISKNMLLNTDYSPCEFLLSYAKLFGLYFVKDPVRKTVRLLTRKNFFKREEIVGIEDRIDRTSVKITPLSYNNKWWKWGLPQVDSVYADSYRNATGKEYGDYMYDTQYSFNSETKEIFDSNIFRTAIQATERSADFYTIGDDSSKPWMQDGYSYELWNSGDLSSGATFDIPKSVAYNKKAMVENYEFYDLFDKPVFHTNDNGASDGSNVLLLKGNDIQLRGENGYLKWFITDDVPEMGVLNSNDACWLYTLSNYSSGGTTIARRTYYCPYYTRVVRNAGTSYLTRTLDYGVPEKLYIPGTSMRSGATMYNLFWKTYMDDVLSKNSRVMKCKVLLTEKPTVDWLRRFYWFDNSIWRMTDISDWAVSEDRLTTCTFIKVQNVENYTSEDVEYFGGIYLTLDAHTVPENGGTVGYHIITLDDSEWRLTLPSFVTASQVSGTTDCDGTLTVGPNQYQTTERIFDITVYTEAASDTESISQEGVDISFYRCDSAGTPVSSLEINKNGETMYFHIKSNFVWTFAAYPDASFISSMSCLTSGNPATEGMIISCVIPRNPSVIDDRYTSFILKVDATGYFIQSETYTQPDRGL